MLRRMRNLATCVFTRTEVPGGSARTRLYPFRNILNESHPSVSWHTPADSMEYYFNWGKSQLKDSMTEPQFRAVLTYVIAKIRCGHTSTRYSRQYLKWLDTARLPLFRFPSKFSTILYYLIIPCSAVISNYLVAPSSQNLTDSHFSKL